MWQWQKNSVRLQNILEFSVTRLFIVPTGRLGLAFSRNLISKLDLVAQAIRLTASSTLLKITNRNSLPCSETPLFRNTYVRTVENSGLAQTRNIVPVTAASRAVEMHSVKDTLTVRLLVIMANEISAA